MLTIACLHTATSNVAVFEAAKAALPVAALRLRHEVRFDLLRAPDDATLAEAARALEAAGADVRGAAVVASTVLRGPRTVRTPPLSCPAGGG